MSRTPEQSDFTQTPPNDAYHGSSLRWVAANLPDLKRRYPEGTWLLVKGDKVLLAGTELPELVRQADELGIENPLVIRMEQPSPARRTAYV